MSEYILKGLVNSNGEIGDAIVVVSHGRSHDFEHWAKLTADRIIQMPDKTDLRVLRNQLLISEAIVSHFIDCIDNEQISLIGNSLRCSASYDVSHYVDNAVESMKKVLPLQDSEIYNRARYEIGSMMVTVVNIERLWFADDNPDNSSARNYKFRMTGVI